MKGVSLLSQFHYINMISKQEQTLKERYALLEKELAAKNRELEIEAALERVRSRSLAMHHTDELNEVVTVVSEKLRELNIAMDGGIIIVTFIEGTRDVNHWIHHPVLASPAKYYR